MVGSSLPLFNNLHEEPDGLERATHLKNCNDCILFSFRFVLINGESHIISYENSLGVPFPYKR